MYNSRTIVNAGCGIITTIVAFKVLNSILRQHVFIPKLTILADIPSLGKPREKGRLPGRAVICGGSIAGLFAAAVCADNYEEVVVIEPEAWLATEEGITFSDQPTATRTTSQGYSTTINKRARVMQYTSTHVTQPVVLLALRELFPNFDEEAAAIGGSPAPCDLHMYIGGELLETPHNQPYYKGSIVESIFLTREGYEKLLRRLVHKYRPNVTFLVGTAAGLQFSENDENLVVGVHVKNEGGSHWPERADLVVDATGPVQTGYYKWLQGRNIPHSLRIQYDPKMYYTTATYQIPPHLQSKFPIPHSEAGFTTPRWLYTFFPDTEVETKSFIMGINENARLIMTCGGWMNKEKPHSPAEIMDYLCSIKSSNPPSSWIFDLLGALQDHRAELNEAYVDLRVPPCSYIKYHEAPRSSLPCNFVAVGDSIMKVNPLFAQGIAKACIGAVTLDGLLRKVDRSNPVFPMDFSTRYFAAHEPRVAGIWGPVKDTDYGLITTVPVDGESLEKGAGSRRFVKHALTVAMKDPKIASTLWNVRMFLAPATDIFSLRLVIKVWWERLNDLGAAIEY